MAATFVSAGVYIQEVDNSLYAPAIAPTIIGIVGTATKGPLDIATLVTNEGQLIDIFGSPRTKDLGIHAALEALKACRLVWFVRIAGAAATSGFVNVLDGGSAPTAATIGPSANSEPFDLIPGSTESPAGTRTTNIRITYDNGLGLTTTDVGFTAVQAERVSGNAQPYNLAAINAGLSVFLDVSIDNAPVQSIVFDPANPVIIANGGFAALTAAGAAHVINSQILDGHAVYGSGPINVIIRSDRYGTGSHVKINARLGGDDANNAVNGFNFSTVIANGSGQVSNLAAVLATEVETRIEAVTAGNILVDVGLTGTLTLHTSTTGAAKSIRLVSASSPALGASPLINLTPLDSTVNGTNSTAAANTIRFTAKTKGSHSANISVRISDSIALASTKKLEVLYKNVVVETFDKLFKSPTPVVGGYAMISTINSGVTNVFAASTFITASDLNPTGENPISGTFTLSTGNDGDNWTAGTVVGTISGVTRTGMQIFRDPEQIYINVLAIPGMSWKEIISEGLDICQTRADCIYVADAPKGLSPADVVKWHNGDSSVTATIDQENRTQANTILFNSSYGALYDGFVQILDKFNGVDIFVPPSAIVLRTFAFTDEVADPWFAPAGPNRTQATSVLDLEYSPTLGERDLMQIQGNNVNPIASIAGVGVVIMGQKTLQRAPTALDRVNVRRLLLVAEKLVSQAAFFLTFDQNDSIMWRRFINLVTPIFEDIKARRGLYGFGVVADSTTTTPVLINQNTFLGKIFLQPTKTAEKLIAQFNILPTGANFNEFSQA
jgi:phage tail sheath protein FI